MVEGLAERCVPLRLTPGHGPDDDGPRAHRVQPLRMGARELRKVMGGLPFDMSTWPDQSNSGGTCTPFRPDPTRIGPDTN